MMNIVDLSKKLDYPVRFFYFGADYSVLPNYLTQCNVLLIEASLMHAAAADILSALSLTTAQLPQPLLAVGYEMPVKETCFKSWVRQMPSDNVILPIVNGQKTEPVCDIVYFENNNRKVFVKTPHERYQTILPMKMILETIQPYAFVSPYVGFAVNLEWIESIGRRDVLLKNKEIIPLSQKRAALVRKAYRDFFKTAQQ